MRKHRSCATTACSSRSRTERGAALLAIDKEGQHNAERTLPGFGSHFATPIIRGSSLYGEFQAGQARPTLRCLSWPGLEQRWSVTPSYELKIGEANTQGSPHR